MTAIDELEAQPVLQPGESGWWKVWGAQPRHIQAGDIILLDPVGDWIEVKGLFPSKAAPVRVGLIDANDAMFTIGALCPIVLMRRGTHNMLA